jgi:hypothetical protein
MKGCRTSRTGVCVGAGALGRIALGQIFHHAYRFQIVTPGCNPSVRRQPIPAGFHPDTSAAAFKPKSPFAFILRVKPSKLQDAFHFPILSGSMDFPQFFNCGLQVELFRSRRRHLVVRSDN